MEVPSLEEFKQVVKRIEAVEDENEFLKSLLLAERWLSRKQAMVALGCQHNKLRKLTLDNEITHRYEGKYPYYCAFSIRTYLTAQKIDAKKVDKRLLSARFAD
ncbi:hypothetical protein [Spirosoma litoris]